MPVFTVPLDESNDCHTPAGSEAGGQFCSAAGASTGKVALIHTSAVTGALKAAGKTAYRYTRREGTRPGFTVKQANPYTIRVDVAYSGPATMEGIQQASGEYEQILTAAGFQVSRPYGDKTMLAVRRPAKAAAPERVDPFKDLEFLKLSNKVLRAFPSSPRQKQLQDKLRQRAKELGAHWWADAY